MPDNETNLKAVDINCLFEGMPVQEDVYDSTASRLIIRSGTTLGAGDIDRIKKLNNGRDTIYVSGDTYKLLLDRMPEPSAASLSALEQSTGYAAVKAQAIELLDNIADKKDIQQEALYSISAELSNQLEVTTPSTILSLINALAPVDEYLQRHCINVSLLNGLLARWLGLSPADVDRMILVGLLHDCGKALIPPLVLNAPRKLTVVEFEVVKMHPVYSYDLLGDFPEVVRRGARYHHEKTNGSGYPDHVTPGSLPIEACITAVSDIYDAMVSQRAYKKPRSPFSIMAMLNELKGTELDPKLVDVFNKNMPLELMDKPVVLSDGSIGIVREIDPHDIEYPIIEASGYTFKSGKHMYCVSMFMES